MGLFFAALGSGALALDSRSDNLQAWSVLNSLNGQLVTDYACMKALLCTTLLFFFAGCSEPGQVSELEQDDSFSAGAVAALNSFNVYADELNRGQLDESQPLQLSGEILQTEHGYKFQVNMINNSAFKNGSCGQIHDWSARKSEAWMFANIFLVGFFFDKDDAPDLQWRDQIHHSDTFYEITYHFEFYGVLIDATADLPFDGSLSSVVLRDSMENKTYQWPYTEGRRPAAGPNHWCFEMGCDACSKAGSNMKAVPFE